MKMTKKKVFWVSLAVNMGVTILDIIGVSKICGAGNISCRDNLSEVFTFTLLFIPLFLLSLITYKMKEGVFRTWLRFSYWWIPLSLFLILISTVDSSGGGFGMHSYGGEDVAIILSVLFFLISLAIISVKSWKLREN